MWTCLTTIGCVYESRWVSAQIAPVKVDIDEHTAMGAMGAEASKLARGSP